MSTNTRAVGLFGGSFNPPHVCHVLASRHLLDAGIVDEVWWLPVHRHAFAKDSSLAPWEHRIAMTEAVASAEEGIVVHGIERELSPPSYTFDTVMALRERHPDCRFSWLIGTDILPELHRWHRWDELRKMLDFLVIGRGQADQTLPAGGRFRRLDLTLPDLSSSSLRDDLAAGRFERVRKAVPPSVAKYLEEHPGLYD